MQLKLLISWYIIRAIIAEDAFMDKKKIICLDTCVLDHLSDGCQIIGFNWSYVYLNDAAIAQARSTREKLMGRVMAEVFPGVTTTALMTQLLHCMKERVSGKMINMFTYPDGATRWFDLTIEPVPEGIFIFSKDITAEMEHG